MELSLICISIYIKCGDCFQDGDKRKVSRDRGTFFFFNPLFVFFFLSFCLPCMAFWRKSLMSYSVELEVSWGREWYLFF